MSTYLQTDIHYIGLLLFSSLFTFELTSNSQYKTPIQHNVYEQKIKHMNITFHNVS